MNAIVSLVLKDLKRDIKRPWSIIVLTLIPIMISALMATIFSGNNDSENLPTIHVALLDDDDDLLAGYLRMIPSQGDASQNLQIHYVESREEGIRMLEKRRASAFVILPASMTVNLLNNVTSSIEIYENPAEQILPQVVRQGVSLLAEGLSGAAEVLQEPLKKTRDLLESDEFPEEDAIVGLASQSFRRIDSIQDYLFPPILQFHTLTAEEYLPDASMELTENTNNE